MSELFEANIADRTRAALLLQDLGLPFDGVREGQHDDSPAVQAIAATRIGVEMAQVAAQQDAKVPPGTGGYMFDGGPFGPRWISDPGPKNGLNIVGLREFAAAAQHYRDGTLCTLRDWELSALLDLIPDWQGR